MQSTAADVKGKLGYLPSDVKVTIVEEKDKYAALSAADFGLLHNGDATVEAAAVQLPSLVVDSRSNLFAYWNNLYNGHASPLNIATNYEAYEDLVGSLTAIGPKLSAIMVKNFQSPKYRYYYAKLYREQIQKILSRSHTNPTLSVA
jgi:lipid A disaccharide synthetase